MNKPESSLDAQAVPFTWPPKACPCGSNQREECFEHGCEWQRDPSLVPAELRIAVAAHPFNQVQEPVAWMNPNGQLRHRKYLDTDLPLYASPQAVPSEQPIAEQPPIQFSDELRARTESERAAYLEGVADGRRYAVRDGQVPDTGKANLTSASGGDASKTALPEEEPDYTCRSCNGTGDGGIPRGPGYSFPYRACGGTGTEPKGQS